MERFGLHVFFEIEFISALARLSTWLQMQWNYSTYITLPYTCITCTTNIQQIYPSTKLSERFRSLMLETCRWVVTQLKPIMAGRPGGHSNHPIHMHPVRRPLLESMLLIFRIMSVFFDTLWKYLCHQVRPLYRYSATLLGASMWFWVRCTYFLRAWDLLIFV